MDRSAFDIAARKKDYRSSGWSGYDPNAAAYSPSRSAANATPIAACDLVK